MNNYQKIIVGSIISSVLGVLMATTIITLILFSEDRKVIEPIPVEVKEAPVIEIIPIKPILEPQVIQETPKVTKSKPSLIVTHIVPVYVPQPAQEEKPEPVGTVDIIEEEKMEYTLEVISPIRGKGLDREYLARDEVKDEANYIELGLVLRANGEIVKDAVVEVVATDTDQNKTLNGTGNMTTIYVNGAKRVVHFYPFHYEFKTAGNHTITFTHEGQNEVVNLEVAEDNRK